MPFQLAALLEVATAAACFFALPPWLPLLPITRRQGGDGGGDGGRGDLGDLTSSTNHQPPNHCSDLGDRTWLGAQVLGRKRELGVKSR